MKVDGEYEVHWVTLKRGFKKPERKLGLLHMPCRSKGIGSCLITARRHKRCYGCHKQVNQVIVDRACFVAQVLRHPLFGFEMRQANLLRWSKTDHQRKLSGLT